MANQQYTVDNSAVGTSAFNVPGVSSSDTSFQVEPEDLSDARQWYVHVENGFNENVDVTVQGSHFLDEGMDSTVADGATETINAGENAAFDGGTGHSYLRVEVTPAVDPTSGTLTVTFQSRED